MIQQPGFRKAAPCACAAITPCHFTASELRERLGPSSAWTMCNKGLKPFADLVCKLLDVADADGTHRGGRSAKVGGEQPGGYPIVGWTLAPIGPGPVADSSRAVDTAAIDKRTRVDGDGAESAAPSPAPQPLREPLPFWKALKILDRKCHFIVIDKQCERHTPPHCFTLIINDNIGRRTLSMYMYL